MSRKTVVSLAHQWAQMLPHADALLRCGNCGALAPVGKIAELGRRCVPRLEMASAGFSDEATVLAESTALASSLLRHYSKTGYERGR